MRESARRVAGLTALGDDPRPLGEMIDERAIVNAIVGLNATGGSTNHTLHLPAIARAAGIVVDWQDFDELSSVVPLLTRIYPNGTADVNHFHRAGGLSFLIGELLDAGLLHGDVGSVATDGGLQPYRQELGLGDDGALVYEAINHSRDEDIARPVSRPFQANGGLRLLQGNLGRAVIKVSAVKPERRRVEAPAVVFHRQEQLAEAFQRGELEKDFVAVVRFQGPRANGMPELHKLMSPLGVLQDRGFQVALVTDGRLSGASGKVPSAIHVTPEALDGPLAKVQEGDTILLDPDQGILEAQVDEETWARRQPASVDLTQDHEGVGRELFGSLRHAVTGAEEGASAFSVG